MTTEQEKLQKVVDRIKRGIKAENNLALRLKQQGKSTKISFAYTEAYNDVLFWLKEIRLIDGEDKVI